MGVDSRRVEADSSAVSTPETPFNLTLSIGPVLLQPLEIHRVCLPPQKTTFQKLKHRLSEIFFPDDPFHRFKNQTFLRKVVLGLHCLFPILQWVPSYSLSTFRSDLVSGLTIASLAIPQVRYKINMKHMFFFFFFFNLFYLFFFLGQMSDFFFYGLAALNCMNLFFFLHFWAII